MPRTFNLGDLLEIVGEAVSNKIALVAGETRLTYRAHLSTEMALRVEKAFGVSMDTLMRMQNSYDIAQTRKRAGEIKVTLYHGKPAE